MPDKPCNHDHTPLKKPDWVRIKLRRTPAFEEINALVHKEGLHTVCEEAMCPNIHECWGEHKTATFMVLGEICTRRCRFCAVKTGLPGAVDPEEPARVAHAIEAMGARHAVITMVTRDDLPDGGAGIIAETVKAINALKTNCSVEVLVSDLMADPAAVATVSECLPEINSHNIETVRRLTPMIRSRSTYERSLRYLDMARSADPDAITKSSIMLGLGESEKEVLEAMDDLRAVDVDMLNIGQYLQPTKGHAPVVRYWMPKEFDSLREEALTRGFLHCESGPFVRSSYHAGEQYNTLLARIREQKRQSYAPAKPHGAGA
jgi:lipoic acid synthetase